MNRSSSGASGVPARRLVLVRHSIPEILPDRAAAEWRLSAPGLERAREFAGLLDPGTAPAVFSSREPKAAETARALSEVWSVPHEIRSNLHEHERPLARMFPREVFEARVKALFERPSEVVFGVESAAQARQRFTQAIMRLVAETRGDVVAVSHGTVMALFVAEVTGAEPFAFWKRLEMPCAVVLSLPDLALRGGILRLPS